MDSLLNGGDASLDRFLHLDEQVQSRLAALFATGLCDPTSLDDRAVSQLGDLPPRVAVEALNKFESGLNKSDVRNQSAYLSSVVRRLLNPTGPSLDELAPEAQQVLTELFEQGHLKRTDLDAKCLRILGSHPPEFQVLALDTFGERSLQGVRNIAAYFTTHIIRTEEQVRAGQLQLPVLGTAAPAAVLPAAQLQLQQQLMLQNQLLQQQLMMATASAATPVVPPAALLPAGMGAGAGVGAGLQQPGFQQGGAPSGMSRGPSGPSGGPGMGGGPPPKHFGVEQAEWGVRIDEFHGLSPLAKYVHPAAAFKLQELWDGGNKLVSLLDDNSWEALAGLEANTAVMTVGETAKTMAMFPGGDVDIPTVNALFVQAASKHPKRPNAPSAAKVLGGGGAPPDLGLGGMPGGGGRGGPPLSPGGGSSFNPQLVGGAAAPAAPTVGGAGGLLGPGAAGVGGLAVSGMMGLPAAAGLQMPVGLGPAGGMLGGLPGMGALMGPGTLMGGGGLPQAQLLMQQPGGMAGGGQRLSGPASMLPASLQQRIMTIVASSDGMVRPEHFDAKVINMMQRLNENEAMDVLEEFARNDFSSIRNASAFLMGILKKYMGGDGGRGEEGYGGGGRGYRGGGRGGGHRGGRGGGRGYGQRYEPY